MQPKREVPPKGPCAVSGCTKIEKSRGWCDRHYRFWRLRGDPCWVPDPRPLCAADGCERVATYSGYCIGHSVRVKRTGITGGPIKFQRKKHPSHDAGTCVCTNCREVRSLSDFNNDRAMKSGHNGQCKICLAAKRAADPSKAYEGARRRRATLRGRKSDKGITHSALRDRDGDKCAYCHRTMDFEARGRGAYRPDFASIDHVLAIKRGGTHTWDNVVLACLRCNMSKRANTPGTEWTAPTN